MMCTTILVKAIFNQIFTLSSIESLLYLQSNLYLFYLRYSLRLYIVNSMSQLLYSVLLPVYNEKENLPIVTHILHELSLKQ